MNKILILLSLTTTIQTNMIIIDPYLKHKKHQLECLDTIGLDPGLVWKLKRGNWPPKPILQVKQWVLCSLRKSGLMTKEGVYNLDVALSRVPKDDVEEVESLIDLCLSDKALPAEDIAYNFVRCYQKKGGNHTFIAIV